MLLTVFKFWEAVELSVLCVEKKAGMYRVYVSDSELESQVLNSWEHMWAANMLEIYNRVLRASACWFSLDNWSHSWSESMGTNLIHTLILAADPELNNREIAIPMLFRTKTEFLIIFFFILIFQLDTNARTKGRVCEAASNGEGVNTQLQNEGSSIRGMRSRLGC